MNRVGRTFTQSLSRTAQRPGYWIRSKSLSAKASNTSTSATHSSHHTASSKVCFIGAGRMAESMINAMKDMPNVGIQVVDVNEKRLELFQEKYGVEVTHSIDEAVEGSDIVILAVKPQQVDAVADSLTKPPTGAVLSIAAGWSIDNLKNAFRTDRIIRSMPNTPSMVQEGMTVWTSTKETPEEVVRLSRALLGSIGEEVEVSEERYLDMATAISGSGPAYVFLVMEAMVDAAVHLGFPRDTAVRLVSTTIRGSATYALKSPETIPQLRANVTSPGGTTASALYELEKGGFRTCVADAVWSAYRRSLELGGTCSNVGPGRVSSPRNRPPY